LVNAPIYRNFNCHKSAELSSTHTLTQTQIIDSDKTPAISAPFMATGLEMAAEKQN
jgi:hypothetical protein